MASQKGHIALYHLGIYMNPPLLEWIKAEYPRHTTARLDMGKSCIRFKKPDQIPLSLIAELAKKMSAKEFVGVYEMVVGGNCRKFCDSSRLNRLIVKTF